MPRYDIVFYDIHNERVGETEHITTNMKAALDYAAVILAQLQGNVHVTSVVVDEDTE